MSNNRRNAEDDAAITIHFWGTRGGIPVPGSQTVRYGGDTSCVEVRCGPHLLILDAGTGLRALGQSLPATGAPLTADLLLTHSHLDHVIGLGFFAPLYRADTTIRLHAGHLPRAELMRSIHSVLTPPLAPDLLAASQARLDFRPFNQGDEFEPQPGLRVRTAPLRHPGGATGYRIAWNGHSVAYVTDTEHEPGQPDPNVLALIRDANVMIYNTDYTDEEFDSRRGWGHSTWQEGVRLADAAGVGTLVLFHHDASRSDDDLDRIAASAAVRAGTVMAFDGMRLALGPPQGPRRQGPHWQ